MTQHKKDKLAKELVLGQRVRNSLTQKELDTFKKLDWKEVRRELRRLGCPYRLAQRWSKTMGVKTPSVQSEESDGEYILRTGSWL